MCSSDLALFKKDKSGQVVGGRVQSGRAEVGAKVRVMREGLDLARLKIIEIQSGRQIVKDVEKGSECGIKIEGKFDVVVNDTLEVYKEERVEKKVK